MAKMDTEARAEAQDRKILSKAEAESVVNAVGLAGHVPLRIVINRGKYQVECIDGKTGFPFVVSRITDTRLKEVDRARLQEQRSAQGEES